MADFRMIRRRVYTAAKATKKGIPNPRFDTSDIAQESMLQILKSENTSLNPSYLQQLGAGNSKMMLRTHLSQKRSMRRDEGAAQINGLSNKSAPCPVEDAIQQEDFINLLQAIESLPTNQQMVIYRRFFDQLAFTEIASELATTYEKVRTLYRNAIKQLKYQLGGSSPLQGTAPNHS